MLTQFFEVIFVNISHFPKHTSKHRNAPTHATSQYTTDPDVFKSDAWR